MLRHDMPVIHEIIIKGQCLVIPEVLQQHALIQLHTNHMDIEKTKLLVHKSVYWIGMYADIENHIETVLHAFTFSKHSHTRK